MVWPAIRLAFCVGVLVMAVVRGADAHDMALWGPMDDKTMACVKGLKSKMSGPLGCCSVADAYPDPNWDRDNKTGRYRVTIEGREIDVPKDAVVDSVEDCGIKFATVWYYVLRRTDGERTFAVRCFKPGPEN